MHVFFSAFFSKVSSLFTILGIVSISFCIFTILSSCFERVSLRLVISLVMAKDSFVILFLILSACSSIFANICAYNSRRVDLSILSGDKSNQIGVRTSPCQVLSKEDATARIFPLLRKGDKNLFVC